jgi:hypothetical protein
MHYFMIGKIAIARGKSHVSDTGSNLLINVCYLCLPYPSRVRDKKRELPRVCYNHPKHIMAASYIAVQVLEQIVGSEF